MNSYKHKFVNPKADGADATLTRPSDWNAEHDYGVQLTNRTLGTLIPGDVVALSNTDDESVVLGDTQDSTQTYVVAQTELATLTTGLFTQSGAMLVKVNTATVRGNYLAKSSAAKALYDTGAVANLAIPPSGALGVALTASGGEGTVIAYLWGFTATGGGGKMGANINSAATIVVPSDVTYATITGAASINSIGARPAGTRISLMFAGACILFHSSQLILNGAHIITVPGEVYEFISEGSGNWRWVYLKSVRIANNNNAILARNAANTVDLSVLYVSPEDHLILGASTVNTRVVNQLRLDIDGNARLVVPVGVNKWAA